MKDLLDAIFCDKVYALELYGVSVAQACGKFLSSISQWEHAERLRGIETIQDAFVVTCNRNPAKFVAGHGGTTELAHMFRDHLVALAVQNGLHVDDPESAPRFDETEPLFLMAFSNTCPSTDAFDIRTADWFCLSLACFIEVWPSICSYVAMIRPFCPWIPEEFRHKMTVDPVVLAKKKPM